MGKRYNKSESRKNQPYNKSKRRRPHPPYDESKSRDRAREAQAIELERGDALDFDLKVPEVNWELPTIPDIDPGKLVDLPQTKTDTTVPPSEQTLAPKSQPKPKINDPFELPEFEVKPKQTKPQVKVAPKPKAPQSLGQKPKPLTREQQIQREIQRRQTAQQQQQQRPQMQRNTQVHPAAVVGPVIVMFIVMAFLGTVNAPGILYLLVLFFFGRQIWNVIQGGGQK